MASMSSMTVRDLRRSNRSRALWQLYLNGPLTRNEIGQAANVSPATVSNVISELVEQGVVVEVGIEDSNGGRPRGLFEVNPAYGYVIGVDIGETAFLVELFDLRMQVRASHRSLTGLTRLDPQDAVTHVLEGVDAVIAESGVTPSAVLGIGIGVPGLVEHDKDGAVVHGQSVGWDAIPLERLMRARTALPLLIDNGAKTLGQAEKWFGAARTTADAVIVLLGTGVGTSIISNQQMYRGSSSSAGEWGHTTVVVDGRLCRCGANGCLEAYIGASAVVARYDELGHRQVPVKPIDLEGRVSEILAAAGTDALAAQVIEETVTYLGAGVSNLVNLFNPQRIVIGGWLGQALATELLPRVRDAAARTALRIPFSHVDIVKAELGTDAVAMGAATLPIAEFLNAGASKPVAARVARASAWERVRTVSA